MAVDPGLKETYLAKITDLIQGSKDRLDRVHELEQIAQFEKAALAGLTAGDAAAVTATALVGKIDLAALQTEETQLAVRVTALQNFRSAVKAL